MEDRMNAEQGYSSGCGVVGIESDSGDARIQAGTPPLKPGMG
jgi:hypothetical protein